MKILLLAPSYPPHIGGAESYAHVIATGMAELGEDVTVVTDGSQLTPSDQDDGIRVERLTRFAAALNDQTKLLWEQMHFSLLEELSAVIDRIGTPDIVLANSNDTAILGRMLGDALEVPVIGNFHEQEPEAGPLGRGRSRLVYERLALDQIIAGSTFFLDKALAHGAPRQRVHLIRHGVDTDTFTPRPATRTARSGPLRIVLTGLVQPRKQQQMMVRIFERLVGERGLDLELVLVGRAYPTSLEYAEDLDRQISESPAKERIAVRQDLSLGGMPDLFRSADIVVQPSTAEGLGLAVLEAMSCGVPVAVAETTGLQEIIRDVHDGILLSPYDETAWVDALEYLATNESLRGRLSRNGRDLVINRFSQTRMVRETHSLLAATVAGWASSNSEQIRLIEG